MSVSLRVAHIDDDEDLRAVVRLALSTTGVQLVASCESGRAALERIPQARPDLILVDLLMPGLDGLETVSALRGKMDLSRVTVVLTTGLEVGRTRLEWDAVGVAAVLAKPFDANSLASRLLSLHAGA